MSEEETPSLRIRDLKASIGRTSLLESFSVEIPRGEHVAIVGPNGAGKTTLLRCLMGLLPPESGSVQINGSELRSLSRQEIARQIAYVPQQLPDDIEFTVREFIEMSRYARHSAFGSLIHDDSSPTSKIIEQTGLQSLAERPLRNLSGGERQRASIAAALAQQCPILILDEPCTHLDPRQEASVHSLIRRIGREADLTILTVTHDLNWASAHFDRILGLSAGRLLFDDTPANFMTPEKLSELYQSSFLSVPHPVTSAPVILPAESSD